MPYLHFVMSKSTYVYRKLPQGKVKISPLYCPCHMGKLGKSAVKSQQQIDFVSKNWFYEQFRTNRCGPPRWDLKPNGMKSCAKELKQNKGEEGK